MKSFREFVEDIECIGVNKEISLKYELGGVLHAVGDKPVKFSKIKETDGFKVVGNIFSTKDLVARYLGVQKSELIQAMVNAIENPTNPEEIELNDAPITENVVDEVDLYKLPIPTYTEKDGGPYIASAIVIANDHEYGRNSSFHRMMLISKNMFSVRILQRHLNEYIERAGGELDVAVVIGSPINVLLASAISVGIGGDELKIANTLMKFRTTKLPNGISVPADAEIVFEATITNEMNDEGPFVDLTGTYDVVRKQRVMKVNRIYHRNNPLFHALLPGGFEHKILMGMPREPTIFKEVNSVADCRGVNITPGGCSWLHAVVSINKKSNDDGRKAIEAAFRGHKSLKHVVIVDDDVDIYDLNEVEWAIATRFQASRGLIIKENEKGSSLDPSADPETRITAKVGLDATKPVDEKEKFEKAKYAKINLEEYL